MQGTMTGFDVLRPDSLAAASTLLAEHGETAKLLAGGTDLLILLRFGRLTLHHLIDLDAVEDARTLAVDESGLGLGALATITQVERSPEVASLYPLLVEAAVEHGSRQIRNSATVAGNLCHASPSAEFAPPLIALGATLRIVTPTGERYTQVEDFFAGPGRNRLERGEIVAAVQAPPPAPNSGAAYDVLKIRKLMDIAVVNAAAWVLLDEAGAVEDVRLALGAVGPTPFRAQGAEKLLRGEVATPDLIEEAAQAAASEAQPITDVRATAEYRRLMTARVARNALKKALERAAACAAATRGGGSDHGRARNS
jgi:CO/xanthine dehydrogenase FAD-binding subunit